MLSFYMSLERHVPTPESAVALAKAHRLRKISTFGPDSIARILAHNLTHALCSLPAARLAWPTKYHRRIAIAARSPAQTCRRKRMIPNQMQKSAHLIENKRSQVHCTQSVAHSLLLFSRKSCVCHSYAKHTRGCTPSRRDLAPATRATSSSQPAGTAMPGLQRQPPPIVTCRMCARRATGEALVTCGAIA
jgi:hypothetical protein